MNIFENKVRKYFFVNKNGRTYYVHSLKHPEHAFEIGPADVKLIKKFNLIYHILWATFISTAAYLFELTSVYKYGFLIFIAAVMLFFFFIEIFYSVKIYNFMKNKKVVKNEVTFDEIKKSSPFNFNEMMLFGLIIIAGMYIYSFVYQYLSLKPGVNTIIFQGLFFLIYYSVAGTIARFLNQDREDK
ncbi:MAG: hypothetical protein ACQESP_03975 [Candidatus Muiribacteriota bacterium]